MDSLRAANGPPPLFFNHQNIDGMATMTSNFIDLTADDDAKSESDDDDLVELTPAQMALAMAEKHNRKEEDTLDVSKLNYSFTMIQRKSKDLPLQRQFIPINLFLRQLDRNNIAYKFTHAQYRRAWGYAVKMKENEFAVNHILMTNPGLDRGGIEAVFAQQIQELVDKVYGVDVTTPYERTLYLHGKASQTLATAIHVGNEKKIKSTLKRMTRMEQTYGIIRDPALFVRQSPVQRIQKTQPAPKNQRKPKKKDSNRVVLAGRVSRPETKRSRRAREESSNPEDNMNFLPMAFNRLGDRAGKEPTPEREVDDSLGLEAWKARQSMVMRPASAPGLPFAPVVTPTPQFEQENLKPNLLPFAPQAAPAPHFEQENLRPNLIPSYDYYYDEELPESQDEHMRYYG